MISRHVTQNYRGALASHNDNRHCALFDTNTIQRHCVANKVRSTLWIAVANAVD
jgi:hypothetical protein